MALLPRLRPALRKSLAAASRPAHRGLHLAPPWLLDDYIPRYHLISSIDASKKRSQAYAHLSNCNLCPRLCGVNRYEKTGVCLIGAEKVKVNTVAPHFGEGMLCSLSAVCMNNVKAYRSQSPVCKVTTVLAASSSPAATCVAYVHFHLYFYPNPHSTQS